MALDIDDTLATVNVMEMVEEEEEEEDGDEKAETPVVSECAPPGKRSKKVLSVREMVNQV